MRVPLPGPAAMARALRSTGPPGLAWLDPRQQPAGWESRPAADAAGGGSTLLAAGPAEVWTGKTEGDWLGFTRAWERRASREPGAVAVGWVEYDGNFRFAAYGQPAFHDGLPGGEGPGEWRFPAGRPGWWNGAILAAREEEQREDRADASPVLAFRGELGRAEYCARVRRAQAHIEAGNIYQVNLAHRLAAPWPAGADPFALYLRLRQVSPAPEAAFLDGGNRTVLCASPELFLDLQGRRARTRPIKGTRPRGLDEAGDETEARALLASAKERAELLMITDLLRNDLGRICPFGEVHVTELLRLERHAQVFHLVSTVEGRLRAEVSHPAALRSCLPGGSITGAPKRRAREIIAELEAPTPRGLYTGALGVFAAAGWSRFNIVIRTLIVEAGEAHFHVGAGIVADSVPEREYEETLHKAAGILRAAGDHFFPGCRRGPARIP